MSPAASCELWVDGVRFADSAADYLAGRPTALDGLKVTWGRGTTVDQPETSTLTAPLADAAGGSSFLDVIPVGSQLEVWAAGVIPGAEAGNVAADPDFETLPPADRTFTPAGLAVSAAPAGIVSGQGIALRASAAGPLVAVLAPDAFSDTITAWDDIPTVEAGVAWSWSLTVRAGPNVTVAVRPVVLADSTRASAGAAVNAGPAQTITGAGPTTLTGTTDPALGVRGWLGLSVAVTITSWQDTPAALTWAAAPGTWDAWSLAELDGLSLSAPATTTRRVMVWAGSVSDLGAGPGAEAGGTAVDVTGVDPSADLANRYVGDTPWLAEALSDRANRILGLSGAAYGIRVDAALAGLIVSWRDVDRQAALGLLTELSESADGVLWHAVHATTGPYLWLEDPASRVPVRELALVGGVVVITGASSSDITQLSAADLIRDETRWTQDVSDTVTRTDVTWLEQLTDPGPPVTPAPTERTVTVVDHTAEDGDGTNPGLGAHRLGRSTQLTTAPDASTVANRILARSRGVPWRLTNLVWDTDTGPAVIPAISETDRANALMDLLDGTRRAGRPMLITELPDWTPAGGADLPVYVEGGAYTFAGGAWHLGLIVTPSQAIGQSVKWNELDPAWRWNQFHPSITWADLIGTGP